MRSVRRLCGLLIALSLFLCAIVPARAEEVTEFSASEESAAMGMADHTAVASTEACDSENAETPLADAEPEETTPAETETADSFDWTEVYTHEFPLYSQLDYPNQRYGSGTVATSGCGITSLAMVASYLTGHTYYPDELAGYFGSYGNNNVDRLRYGSDKLKLPYRQAENYHVALDALRKGK